MATVEDLPDDEKCKIGNLLRELARSQREAQQAANDKQEYAKRLQRMRMQNDSIIQVRAHRPRALRIVTTPPGPPRARRRLQH